MAGWAASVLAGERAGLGGVQTAEYLIVAPPSGQDGPAWLLLPRGAGALYTLPPHPVQHSTLGPALFTGPGVTWLYPDWCTALVGEAVAARLLAAQPARVTTVRVGQAGLPELSLAGTGSGQLFRFQPSTDTRLAEQPLLRDPYEERLLGVQSSEITGAGLGVFAHSSLPNNTIGIPKHQARERR